MPRRPAARTAYRVPRSAYDAAYDTGAPSPGVRYVSGVVLDTQTDTLTAEIYDEAVPNVAVLGDMPAVGEQVDIFQVGSLLYVPVSSQGGLMVVHHGTDGTVARPNVSWVLWLGTATPVNGRPYDVWEEANI